ncbi:MAG: CTP synthase, partial [bacterium]|nr:CTP synthase [bacterium]
CAVIEFARHVCGLKDASSEEFHPNAEHKVIALMAEQKNVREMGGTMRLGAYPCVLARGSKARTLYRAARVEERHRHRYEVNNAYRDEFARHGLIASGLSPDGRLVEIIELTDHPFFLATQAHPEFQSQPTRPHPLFRGFIHAALAHAQQSQP